MIGFTLTEMLAAADTPTEDEPEKIALSKIPGPPIPGLKPETDSVTEDSEARSAEASAR